MIYTLEADGRTLEATDEQSCCSRGCDPRRFPSGNLFASDEGQPRWQGRTNVWRKVTIPRTDPMH